MVIWAPPNAQAGLHQVKLWNSKIIHQPVTNPVLQKCLSRQFSFTSCPDSSRLSKNHKMLFFLSKLDPSLGCDRLEGLGRTERRVEGDFWREAHAPETRDLSRPEQQTESRLVRDSAQTARAHLGQNNFFCTFIK